MLGRKTKLTIASALLAPHLCGSAPPRGTSGEIAFGAGRHSYERGGCGGPVTTFYARELAGQAGFAQRMDNGVVVSAEAAAVQMRTVSTDRPGTPLPRDRTGGYGAVRVGYRGEYWGAQIGPAVVVDDSPYSDELSAIAVPSGSLWLGPDLCYVYADFLAGPMTHNALPIGAGVGHQGEWFRAATGIALGFDDPSWRAGAQVAVTDRIWAGADLTYANPESAGALLTVGFEVDGPD